MTDIQGFAASIARKIEHGLAVNSPESLPDVLWSLIAQLDHYGRPCDCPKAPRYNGVNIESRGGLGVVNGMTQTQFGLR